MISRIIPKVFILKFRVICELVPFTPFFSPMRYASAGGLEIKSPSNNNLPTLTNDVMVNPRNPENPDSNQWLLRA
jgi:hypothetical protein